MLKTWPLLLLLAVVHCQMGRDVNVDIAINSIFGTAPGTTTESPRVDKPEPSTFVPPTNTNNGTNGEEGLVCTMEDGTFGQCVIYYLCDKNNTIVDDGVGVIDIRFGEDSCVTPLDACCLPRNVRPTDNPIKPQPQPPKEGCGWRNPKGADMRTTGETDGETKFGEFPWMVAILKKEPVNEIGPDDQKLDIYFGGGSLIALNVVLTAAHIASSGPLKVRAGEWDTANTKEIYLHQDRDVTSMEIHQDFNGGNLFNDVALLFLSMPVISAPNVGVVCLPPPQQRTPAATKCFATGWGKDKFGIEGQNQVILKKIEIPVVERNACQTTLRKTRLGRFFQLHTSFMCAGGEKGKDTCKGDGGSPLSCPITNAEGRYMQSGIVAWGIGCGEDGTPGVYMDVSSIREWIDEKMVSKGLDTRTYTI